MRKIKKIVSDILRDYLDIFPDEQNRQGRLLAYLENHNDEQITDWNNFDGHIVASAFVYAKLENLFLVLYHNDMKIFVYPGGHIDSSDKNPLEAAKREVTEETGLDIFEIISLSNNDLIPIDIDTHIIGYNERLNLPEHYHYDFRYLFAIDKISDITIDTDESSEFKWIDIGELNSNPDYKKVIMKMNKILK